MSKRLLLAENYYFHKLAFQEFYNNKALEDRFFRYIRTRLLEYINWEKTAMDSKALVRGNAESNAKTMALLEEWENVEEGREHLLRYKGYSNIASSALRRSASPSRSDTAAATEDGDGSQSED